MKYVLDASVALKWVLVELDSPAANKLRDQFRQQIHELIAPDTILVEVAHALTRAELRGAIRVGEGSLLLGDFLSTRPALEPYIPLLPRAVELSSQSALWCLRLSVRRPRGAGAL